MTVSYLRACRADQRPHVLPTRRPTKRTIMTRQACTKRGGVVLVMPGKTYVEVALAQLTIRLRPHQIMVEPTASTLNSRRAIHSLLRMFGGRRDQAHLLKLGKTVSRENQAQCVSRRCWAWCSSSWRSVGASAPRQDESCPRAHCFRALIHL